MEATGIGLAPIVNRNSAMRFLFEQLREKYPEVPLLKVAEGEKLVLTTEAATGIVRLHYAQLVGADVPKSTDEGGSLSKNKLFLSHSKKNLTIAASATEINILDAAANPAGMFTFPFEIDAPANYVFELLGFAFGVANKHADITIDGMRIWHMDKAVYGRDEAFNAIESFPYLPNTSDNKLFLLSAKEVVRAGDELKTEIQASNVNVAPQTVDVYCTHIFLQKKLS